MISLIILAIGIASVINAIQAHLVIKTASGEILDILFLIFEKNKAENTAECLKRRISERFTDTDVHYHTQEQTERLVSAIHSLKN